MELACNQIRIVMAGLVPAIHGLYRGAKNVDARDKPGHDEFVAPADRINMSRMHARLALALLARGDHQGARAEAECSLDHCPNLAAGHGALGVVLAYSGEPQLGLAALGTCLRLDPRSPALVNRLNQVALAHYFCRDYVAAVAAAERAIRAFPDFPSPHRWLAAALGQLGRTGEARRALAQATLISASEIDFQVRHRPPWFRMEDHAHMLEGLRQAGWAD
jgi:adenylate cyclase